MREHRFERGDALVFPSHKYHCVSEVTSGRRVVLVAELWEGLARTCPQRCSDPFGACYCKFEPAQTELVVGGAQCAFTPEWTRVTTAGTCDSPQFVRSA